jgi:hypothetical protein
MLQVELALSQYEETLKKALEVEQKSLAEEERLKHQASQEARADLHLAQIHAEMAGNGQAKDHTASL